MINVGSYIIIQKLGGDHLRLNRVRKSQKILIEKLKFDITGAIGLPFGLFEVSAGQITSASKKILSHSTLAANIIKDECNKICNILIIKFI